MKERVKKILPILIIGVLINAGLTFMKMYVGISSNSLCIMLDGLNSLFDIITCIVTIIAFVVLLQPVSKKAPFGYGRVEYLSSFIVAVVSCVVGVLFFVRSLNRMAMPEPVWYGATSCILISIAVPIKFALGLLYYFTNKKHNSKALKALTLDSFLDTGMTAMSLVSFAVSSQVDYAVDAILGIVISIIVVIFAIKMIIDSVKAVVVGDDNHLEKKNIKTYLKEKDGIKDVYNVVLHDYGHLLKVGTVDIKTNRVFSDEEILSLESDIKGEIGIDIRIIAHVDNK